MDHICQAQHILLELATVLKLEGRPQAAQALHSVLEAIAWLQVVDLAESVQKGSGSRPTSEIDHSKSSFKKGEQGASKLKSSVNTYSEEDRLQNKKRDSRRTYAAKLRKLSKAMSKVPQQIDVSS